MDIATMPRGGFDASWLDRRLQTDRPEFLDRNDIDDRIKRGVIRWLDRMGRVLRDHEHLAGRALPLVSDIAEPRILELGAGHGALSQAVLDMHPTAQVTVTDIDPISVSNIAAGELGRNPRAVVRQVDATDIDAPDRSYDLALFALSFHHLPPAQAARVLAEATRVADRFVVCDIYRPAAAVHVLRLASMLPFALVWPFAHDGLISSLRAYSASAFRALAASADSAITVEFSRLGRNMVVVASRTT
ncbi:class I SAM-dependent methyltransferase [Mycolicibacterium sphagni]|uniref:class I SAM-dependent methyltransferase n=1 Tax=Mycolicibacterium sphagni TaxID=1786 RepID=UPI0021F27373|nr:class I SAM-dependent methyltransferase [Mycolicibacterium sphagni]MCV7178577.1 methyltransferase domain-containing protein [Mycolicibacterium sphagni]